MQLFIWTLKAITLRPVLSRGANSQSWQEVFLTTFMTCLSADVSIASTKEASSSSAGTVAEYCANQMMVLIQEPSSSSSTTTTSSSSSNTSAISILTKASKGHFNMFWQQKLYLTLYPIFNQKLTDMLAQASSSVNTGSIHQEVLTAICKLIQGISSQLLKSNMSELKSSMMKILSFLHVQEQQSQQQGGMKKINTEAMLALQRMIQEDVSIFVEQLHIIIPRLLQVSFLFIEPRLFQLTCYLHA